LPVCFNNAINGTLGTSCTVTETGASASATFTPTATPAASAGAQIDNATATAGVLVQDFALTGSAAQTINPGTATAVFDISVAELNGFTGTVGLSITNSSGLSANLSSASISNEGVVTLTVQTASVAAGAYSLSVSATSGSLSHQVTVQLTVSNFSVSVSPSSQTVDNGTNADYTVTVSGTGGFSGVVTLSINSAYGVFADPQLNLSTTTTSASSPLTITAPTGTYSLTISATSSNGTVRTTSVQLTVILPTYVPTTYTNGGTEGGFTNPLAVVPGGGGSSAYVSGGYYEGGDNFAEATWAGWSGTGSIPSPAYLYVTVSCTITSIYDGAELFYSLNGGQTYSYTILNTNVSVNGTYKVALPTGQVLSEVSVLAYVYGSPNSEEFTYAEMGVSDMYIQ
jgi:hypothetical protein